METRIAVLRIGATLMRRPDLSAIDADTTTTGHQAFTLAASFTHVAAQAVLSYQAGLGVTYLDLDVNGDGVSDGRIIIEHGDHTNFHGFLF